MVLSRGKIYETQTVALIPAKHLEKIYGEMLLFYGYLGGHISGRAEGSSGGWTAQKPDRRGLKREPEKRKSKQYE